MPPFFYGYNTDSELIFFNIFLTKRANTSGIGVFSNLAAALAKTTYAGHARLDQICSIPG
jgi:hypothetical protein